MVAEHVSHHTLVFHCVGALLQRTLDCPTAAAHQQALQGFLDDLAPWISPGDLPLLVQQPFTPLDQVMCTPHDDEDIAVALSPQGTAVLRAWLRQRGPDPLVCRS